MGLFDGLFGGFEKLEKRGDEAFARGDAIEAHRRFRNALVKAGGKDPLATERLQAKAERARQLFVKQKIEEAGRFIEDEVHDAAIESLQIAREYLGDAEDARAEEINQLEEKAWSALGGPQTDTAGAPSPAPAPELDEPVPLEDESDEDLMFHQLLGTLAAADREHAETLGPAFRQGFVAHQQGAREEALAALKQAAEDHPNDALVLERLAQVEDELGQIGQAKNRYFAVLEHAPSRLNSRLALAAILAGTESSPGTHAFTDWWLASQSYNRRKTPEGQDEEERDLAEALALLEQGAKLDVANEGAYLIAAADICLSRARPQDAARHLDRAVELSRSPRPELWRMRGAALEMSGQTEEAEAAYEQAAELGGHAMLFRAEFAQFALRHRRALERAGDMIFETCLGCQAGGTHPDDLDYYGFLLTQIQFARGQHKDALEGIDRLLKKGPPPELEPQLVRLRREVVKEMARESKEDAHDG